MTVLTTAHVRRAIARGELDVVYQPEVDLRTGHIAAVEALVRWCQPDVGLVLPPEFIPLAERSGQIGEITTIVLRRALEQAASWSTARWDGGALPVCINLAAAELADHGLPGRIARALEEFSVAPSQLGLEITESAPIIDTALAASTLRSLQETGVRIALDDFGTGYSMLSHLRDLPVDVVKIDRRFIRGLTDDSEDLSIVKAIIQMAHSRPRIVVAEGVEDTTQQQALVELGCDLGQGYLYASPQQAHCVDVLLCADRELATQPEGRRSAVIPLPRPRRAVSASDLLRRSVS